MSGLVGPLAQHRLQDQLCHARLAADSPPGARRPTPLPAPYWQGRGAANHASPGKAARRATSRPRPT
eukprot:2721949-Pyramimonas_sp.AAC.1